MSTGMSTLEEIRLAMGVYLLGALETNTVPYEYESERGFVSEKGQSHLKNNMILLHCTTQYPAPYEDVNLLAMELLADEFGLPVGYSDHTEGIAVSIAAAAMGAVVIEKHFTLDKNLPGPDHKASVSPGELKDLVENVKKTKLALGKRVKFVSPSESSNICIARKSLTALTDIKKGELFTWQNLGTKRPGTGVSPAQFWKYLGRPADREYQEDDQL
jgi:N-acetylneuraminate synthase